MSKRAIPYQKQPIRNCITSNLTVRWATSANISRNLYVATWPQCVSRSTWNYWIDLHKHHYSELSAKNWLCKSRTQPIKMNNKSNITVTTNQVKQLTSIWLCYIKCMLMNNINRNHKLPWHNFMRICTQRKSVTWQHS